MINQTKDEAEGKSCKDAMFLAQIQSGHCVAHATPALRSLSWSSQWLKLIWDTDSEETDVA